jgi:BirA family biotin operon repressor/biotin-[acetyl-CoA-carboxylase] ligase
MFDLGRIERCGIVARIEYHESIGSTSDRAMELGALDEAKLPLLVLAERQTAGRGRGANRWWSAEGALTFSLALEAPRDRLPPDRWPQVALAAGVAVCEALEGQAPRAELRVKWPNDVYLAGGKVCGILCESIPGMNDRLVVGIGVNVNNKGQGSGLSVQEENWGRGIANGGQRTTAASLLEYDDVQRELTAVLIDILDQFDRRWRELVEHQFAAVAAVYRMRCLLTSKTVKIEQAGGSTIIGVCRGIDEFGRLLVQTQGRETAVVSGTVASWNG